MVIEALRKMKPIQKTDSKENETLLLENEEYFPECQK